MAEISDEDYVAQHPEHSGLDPAIRAQLRQNAQLAADLESERANRLELERRATFAEAGLSDHPARELLESKFEAGMTAEQLKETAAKYGLSAATPGTPAPPENQADLDALRRVGQASGGTPTGGPIDFGDALDRVRSKDDWTRVMQNAPTELGMRLTRTAPDGSRII